MIILRVTIASTEIGTGWARIKFYTLALSKAPIMGWGPQFETLFSTESQLRIVAEAVHYWHCGSSSEIHYLLFMTNVIKQLG